MRELKVVGLDADGKYILCEGVNPPRNSGCRPTTDCGPRWTVSRYRPSNPQLDIDVTNMLSPKEIQARIRAGASVEQVAAASRSDMARIQRFAHPVLLERYRAAELATAAHPILADGPAVLTPAGDRHHRVGVARPEPRETQLGRLAQRRQPVDGAAGVEGRPVRQPRAFPIHSRRPRRHGHRARRGCQRADRPELQASATGAGGAPRLRCLRGARAVRTARAPAASPRRPSKRRAPGGASRPSRPGRTCCSGCAQAVSASRHSGRAAARQGQRDQANPRPGDADCRTQHKPAQHRACAATPRTSAPSPPTATMLRPTASSGCTRISPRLSTTIAAPLTAATNPATAKPVAQGTDSSFTTRA